MELAIYIIELIGTAAFAISGALICCKRKLDVFGVCSLGCVTALGGGVTRDVIIGNNPPAMFQDYIYLVIAFVASLLVFILLKVIPKEYEKHHIIYSKVVNVFDALGLGVFAAVGVQISFASNPSNGFLCVFVGVLTACGGGILRDVMSSATPIVFKKEIYALAAIAGALVTYIMLICNVDSIISIIVGTVATFIIRIVASILKWNLPTISISEEDN